MRWKSIPSLRRHVQVHYKTIIEAQFSGNYRSSLLTKNRLVSFFRFSLICFRYISVFEKLTLVKVVGLWKIAVSVRFSVNQLNFSANVVKQTSFKPVTSFDVYVCIYISTSAQHNDYVSVSWHSNFSVNWRLALSWWQWKERIIIGYVPRVSKKASLL
jgi:hypothetical protein